MVLCLTQCHCIDRRVMIFQLLPRRIRHPSVSSVTLPDRPSPLQTVRQPSVPSFTPPYCPSLPRSFRHPSLPSVTHPYRPSPLRTVRHPSVPSVTPPYRPSPICTVRHPSVPSVTPPRRPSPLRTVFHDTHYICYSRGPNQFPLNSKEKKVRNALVELKKIAESNGLQHSYRLASRDYSTATD